MTSPEENLYKIFDQEGLSYEVHEHPAVFTVAESNEIQAEKRGAKTKNLFLRNKKKTAYFLVSLQADTRVDLKGLSDVLGAGRLSFASPADLKTYLNIEPGSVTPFSLINDPEQKVAFYLDKQLTDSEIINFHPLRNTATVEMPTIDFLKAIAALDHELNTINIPEQ